MSVIEFSDLNVQKIGYKKPYVTKHGGKLISMTYLNKRFIFQFPLLTTWGLSEASDSNGNPTGNFSYALQSPSNDFPDEDGTDFFEKMKEFELAIKKAVVANCMQWFGKKLTMDSLDLIWTPIVKYSKYKRTAEDDKMDRETPQYDLTKPPTLNIKVKDFKKFEIYNTDDELVWDFDNMPGDEYDEDNDDKKYPADIITPLSKIAGQIEPVIWISASGCGVTLKTSGLKRSQVIVESEQSSKGTCKISLSKNDKKKLGKGESDNEEEKFNPTDATDTDDEADKSNDSSQTPAENEETTVVVVENEETVVVEEAAEAEAKEEKKKKTGGRKKKT